MAVEPREISSEEYNKNVAGWASQTGVGIRNSIQMLTHAGKGELLRNLRTKTRQTYGEISAISYQFPRHGVFFHKGVGRGYKMVGGKVMRVSGSVQSEFIKQYAKLQNRTLAPRVLTGVAMKRDPKEWFNPIIESRIDMLANMIVEMRANQVINATKIFIK